MLELVFAHVKLDPINWVLLAWGIVELRRLLTRVKKMEKTGEVTHKILVAAMQRVEQVETKLDHWNRVRREATVTPIERPKKARED